jgi:hypothetical protein
MGEEDQRRVTVKNTFVITSIMILLLAINSTVFAFGMLKINVKVVDETGIPLADTKLSVRFSGGEMPVMKNTDDQGICSITSSSGDGVVVGTAMKEGFYNSTFHHDFYVTRFGMWQPWGKELAVVMRPIVNPVPMYVRNHSFKVPVKGEEVGFDLEKADWVIPYGLGTKADFIFKLDQRYDNGDNYDATMTLTFVNPFDGIQVVKDDGGGDFNVGSWFRLPRTAPDTGYLPKMQKRISRGSYGRHSDIEDDNNYLFRVRSEVDEYGKLERAMYGKIRGELRHFVGDGGGIKMHYYLNPDYTPNLEFDPKRNLFIILSGSENVTHP